MRSNDIISFLMVDGLRSNAVITFLMEDQNTNEPVVMWTVFVIKECIKPLQIFVTRAYRIIWSTYCGENLCKSYSASGHKSINPVTASFLNHDLYKVHILSSPACSCGAPQEDANHFFFVCIKYSEIRNDLFLSISDLSQLINTLLLTSGSETLSYADNCFIFYSVFRFMKRSKRFLIV